MVSHPNPVIVTIVSFGSLVFGLAILRWILSGMLEGKLRYRFMTYDRNSCPIRFWFAAIWALGSGAVFSFAGLAMLYLGVIKRLL
jgi:hypothetical protein